MRADLFLELADAVEASPERGHRFDMRFWGNDAMADGASCGTAGCMGGIAAQIWPKQLKLLHDGPFVFLSNSSGCQYGATALAEVLEITARDAAGLFGSLHAGEETENAAYHANRLREYVRRRLAEDAK